MLTYVNVVILYTWTHFHLDTNYPFGRSFRTHFFGRILPIGLDA